jgi:hypothetical protein
MQSPNHDGSSEWYSFVRMNIRHIRQTWILCFHLALSITLGESGFTQVVGEIGEMDRLEQQADDAIANEDPEGAALSIGKAALMAGLIGRKEETPHARLLYQAAETLFRGQEQGYRAIALFERAGGQPPASKGVCQFLSHAAEMVKESGKDLKALEDFNKESLKERRQRHIAKSKEWGDLLQGLQQDLSC